MSSFLLARASVDAQSAILGFLRDNVWQIVLFALGIVLSVAASAGLSFLRDRLSR